MTDKRVVGVRFRHAGKVYYFEPGDTDLRIGDTVIVETVRGVEAAQVVVANRLVPEESLAQPLRTVLRKATAEDASQLEENHQKEREALKICEEKIAEHKLDMQLVGADYTFDRGKLIFYFTSEGRVDFRQLVRDLSATFKTRIELRQIGVRDEAKMLGGLGSCGRQLCCSTFLSEFLPVSIRMAKRQDLSLNPTKISGLCGRLMCCLRYESESYPDTRSAAATSAAGGPAAGAGGQPPAADADGQPPAAEAEPGPGVAGSGAPDDDFGGPDLPGAPVPAAEGAPPAETGAAGPGLAQVGSSPEAAERVVPGGPRGREAAPEDPTKAQREGAKRAGGRRRRQRSRGGGRDAQGQDRQDQGRDRPGEAKAQSRDHEKDRGQARTPERDKAHRRGKGSEAARGREPGNDAGRKEGQVHGGRSRRARRRQSGRGHSPGRPGDDRG